MEPSAFIALVGASIGAILGATITYFFSIKAAKINLRKIAGAKLRVAFAPEIADYKLRLKKHIDFELDKIFWNSPARHSAAIEEYRWFVPLESQRAYQQAWENYYWKLGGVYFTDYLVGKDRERIFQQRIDAIFKFTEL